MAAVAGKDVVSAGRRQQHLDPIRSRAFGDQQRIDWSWICLRLIQSVEHSIEVTNDVGLHFNGAKLDAEVFSNASRVGKIGGATVKLLVIPESDRIADGRLAELGALHHCDHRARVESAR